MEGSDADRMAVMAALGKLGVAQGAQEHPMERLAGGLSGSSVWRVEVDGRAMVLKLTGPESHAEARERADREWRFYRELGDVVPIDVPEVLGESSSPAEGTAVLLAAYPPAPPLVDWRFEDYQQVARDLGLLHGTYRDRGTVDLPGWLSTQAPVSLEMAAEASAQWGAIDVPENLIPLRRVAGRLALEVPRLDGERARLPHTLCHGDAHRDNLLQGETDGWIWADWQDVRLAEGVGDLSFFWQRAFTVTDSVPPVERLLGAYVEGLSRAGVPGLTEDVLGPAIAWTELMSWLIAWPPYMGWLEPGVRGRVLQRIDAIVRRLELDVN
jgi:Ser/Thr protein kinase RdoA (MazF antagonist)